MKVMIKKTEIDRIVKRVAEEISRDYCDKSIVLIGVLKGAFRFYADLVKHLHNVKITAGFIEAKSYCTGTRSEETTLFYNDTVDVAGKDVIIVDDMIDTGHTLKKIKAFFKEKKAKTVKFCVLLDKHSRREVKIDPEYIGTCIEDKFVFGYGIDKEGMGRELHDIVYTN